MKIAPFLLELSQKVKVTFFSKIIAKQSAMKKVLREMQTLHVRWL